MSEPARCPLCRQIVRRDHGVLVLTEHYCPPLKRTRPRRRREDASYRRARLVDEDIDRSPDSDPYDTP